jgi:pyrimidine-nucleoside phosphorylase
VNARSVIEKKRDGGELTAEEIGFLVDGAVSGTVPPYQLTAWMMAVYFQGMTPRETAELTRAMIDSGDRLPVIDSPFLPVDKHSTGGVGDKLSFLVAPLVAAAGVPVPMISGRALGHTGGTLDKLESIPGYRTALEPEELSRQLERIGICLAGQSASLVPADRILYGLRDAASIVESVPLITASILSKKAAEGARALVLDVKVGSGAFMREMASGRNLASWLVETAALLGLRSRAHLTAMDRVLGRTAGNALEVAESVRALRGDGTAEDLRALTLALGGSMLDLAGAAASAAEGARRIEELWRSGHGYEKFLQLIEAQGGERKAVEGPEGLPRAGETLEVPAKESGVFLGLDARPVGEWIVEAGGGRSKAEDPIDHAVGVECLVDPRSKIVAGEPIVRLHLSNEAPRDGLERRAQRWVLLDAGSGPPAGGSPDPVLGVIDPAG